MYRLFIILELFEIFSSRFIVLEVEKRHNFIPHHSYINPKQCIAIPLA